MHFQVSEDGALSHQSCKLWTDPPGTDGPLSSHHAAHARQQRRRTAARPGRRADRPAGDLRCRSGAVLSSRPTSRGGGIRTHDLFVPNADSMHQDWSASAIELHRCDRQWCRVPRRIDLSAASLLPIDPLIRRHRPRVRPDTICRSPGKRNQLVAGRWTTSAGAELEHVSSARAEPVSTGSATAARLPIDG
jgi:hypothetical protein